jgi:hypothetical protein
MHEMLEELGIIKCQVPMIETLWLVPNMGSKYNDPTIYQHVVGKLIYLTHTRPNLCYVMM